MFPLSSASMICNNPGCPLIGKLFCSESALSQHMARSAGCTAFLLHQQQKMASGSCPLQSNKRHRTTSVIAASANKASALQSHFVNNAMITGSNLVGEHNDNDSPVNGWYDENATGRSPTGTSASTTNFPTDSSIYNDSSENIQTVSPYTVPQKWTVELLKILDEFNAPDQAFEEIIRWAQGAYKDGFNFEPPAGVTRNRNITIMCKSLQNAQHLLPSVKTVTVPHGNPCDVVVFDFVPQLLHLLQSPTLMSPANLAIDYMNPLKKYQSPNNRLGKAISGSIYSKAYDRFITDPSKQFFVPIIQWIDRTHVTGNERYTLKPYMFTPAIFKEECRRYIHAWGYHGFLPKPKWSKAEAKLQAQGNNMRNTHAQLAAVLESFRTSAARLKNIKLPLGPTGDLTVDIVPCILFIIQDMQEGDTLCGQYAPHSPAIQRQHRACNVSYQSLGDPMIKCKWLYAEPMHHIATCGSDEVRQRWSQHNLINVFRNMPMADPIRGVQGSTPIETMHAFRKGMVEKVSNLILANLGVGQQAALDAMTKHFHVQHSQTCRATYPTTQFPNGVTGLTKITAAEHLGMLFLFVILAHIDRGRHIFKDALALNEPGQVKTLIALFERMLIFDAWLKKDSYWTIDEPANVTMQKVQKAIRAMMQTCCDLLPDQWNFPKFHELLHIVSDMQRFGAPRNYCAQRPESLLIYAAKRPGRRAQKRQEGAVYELSSAQRLSQSFIINMYYNIVHPEIESEEEDTDEGTNDSAPIPESSGQATHAKLSFLPTSNQFHLLWSTTTNISRMQLNAMLLQFVHDQFGSPVTICTEYCRDRLYFRCHPFYQSRAPRFDWLRIQFESGVFPCRLATVVVLT